MVLSDDIHNYYEKLVLDHFKEIDLFNKYGKDYLADLTCIVLNQLPPRYIRHEVDMAFYLPTMDRAEMVAKVKQATIDAIDFMKAHERNEAN
jgi:hypothetical protein